MGVSIGEGGPESRGVSAKFNVKVAYIDELLKGGGPPRAEPEPLIDVIEEDDGYRVVVLLPGVRREDVAVKRGPGSLRVEVTKGGTVYAKEIPCAPEPSKVTVVSARENNSVVELVFAKRRGGR